MLKRFCVFLCIALMIPNFAYYRTYALDISAYSAAVVDGATGTVLFEKNAYEPMPMASTTKIMTCLLACESGKLDDVVTVTDEMLKNAEGSSIYLETGDKITLLDLIKGAMLASGNDAANSIAVYLAGSIDAFAQKMNSKAKEIGMQSTLFVTPSGLDKGNHHSTAYDMAILASKAVENNIFADICSLKSAEIEVNSKKQTIYNHNKLLSSSENFIGVKTGFTEKAGRCLVSAYKYNGNKIICVTLGAPNDWQDHKLLVEEAKDNYIQVKSTDDFVINAVGGTQDSIICTCTYDVTTLGAVNVKALYYPFVYAPVKKGDIIGKAEIYSNNKIIKTVNIIATEGINIYGKQ